MSVWTRLGRNCPICNGDRKHNDCRQSVESGLVFCHDDKTNPLGWIFRGFDKHGFGIWQNELEARAFSKQSKEERQRERLERQQQQRQRKRAQIAAQMPVDERDRWNRKLLKILSLNQSDRANLEARGFQPARIEAEGYRSITQWQAVSESFPANFPGRTIQGNLAAKRPGILCPIPNVEQEILGFQIRRHDDSEGRYGWLSSKVAPVHLDSELPLGVYQPEQFKGQAIVLTDSPAIKSGLAAQLFGVPVVGATNGNFHGSPKLTRHTLSVLSERYQTTHLILALDAGDVKNRAVCQRWQQQHKFLTDLGYLVQFAWWGQVEKTDCDIDELKPGQFEEIQFISLKDFETIAVEHGGLKPCLNPPSDRLQQDDLHAPDLRFIEALQQQEREQERIEEAQAWEELARTIKATYSRAAYKYWKRFGSLPPQPKLNPKVSIPAEIAPSTRAIVPYDPTFALRRWILQIDAQSVPGFETWQRMGNPILIYESRDRLAIAAQLVEYGYPLVVIADVTGSGKSEFAGQFLQQRAKQQFKRQQQAIADNGGILPANFRFHRAYYTSSDYRNPSTASLEAIPETVNAGALVYDFSKQTPSGQPYRKRAGQGQMPDIAALCIEDHNIQSLRSKGIDVRRGKNSPFCQNCHQQDACEYLQQQAKQRQIPVLRTHLNKLTPAIGDVALIDEAGRDIQATRQTKVSWTDLETELNRIARLNGRLYQQIQPLLDRITQSLQRAVAECGFHGLTHFQLLQFLPSKSEVSERLWNAIAEDWLTVTDPWDFLDGVDRIERTIQPYLTDSFVGVMTPESKAEVIKAIFTAGIISTLIQAILEIYPGSLTLRGDGQLVFTRRNQAHSHSIRQCATAFLMDGTPDLQDLARKLGVRPHQICTIKAITAPFTALTIKRVRGLGRVGQQRKQESPDSVQQRIEAAIKTIAQDAPHPDRIGILDLKRFVDRYPSLNIPNLLIGHHFADNRNSNRFRDCTTLISVPLATQHLGLLLAQWQTLTHQRFTLDAAPAYFWSWVNQKATQELIQDIGRTRAQYRQGEQITHWILSEINDQQWQEVQSYFPECQAEEIDVYDLCPEAAPSSVQTERGIVSAIWNAVRANRSIKISEVAQLVGVSASRVSQVVKPIAGGYKALQKSLAWLLESLNNRTKFSDLPEELKFIAETYLPCLIKELEHDAPIEEVSADFCSIPKQIGRSTFRQVLAETPIRTLTRLLTEFLQVLPSWFLAHLEPELDMVMVDSG